MRALNQQLDLQKFIHRQRVQTTALMGLLSGSQQFFVHRLSKLFIKEIPSSTSSESDDLEVVDKDEFQYIEQMCASNSDVDHRFLNFFKVMREEKNITVNKKNIDQRIVQREKIAQKNSSIQNTLGSVDQDKLDQSVVAKNSFVDAVVTDRVPIGKRLNWN